MARGAQAVPLLDHAGWHTTSKFAVPATITLLSLPAQSPELNLVKTLRQFLRDGWLGRRIRLIQRVQSSDKENLV